MLANERKTKEIIEVKLYLNSKPLQQAKSITYLGITVDTKLNFREHIISTINKCTQLIHTSAKSAKLNWGLSKKRLTPSTKSRTTTIAVWRNSMGQSLKKELQKTYTIDYNV